MTGGPSSRRPSPCCAPPLVDRALALGAVDPPLPLTAPAALVEQRKPVRGHQLQRKAAPLGAVSNRAEKHHSMLPEKLDSREQPRSALSSSDTTRAGRSRPPRSPRAASVLFHRPQLLLRSPGRPDSHRVDHPTGDAVRSYVGMTTNKNGG